MHEKYIKEVRVITTDSEFDDLQERINETIKELAETRYILSDIKYGVGMCNGVRHDSAILIFEHMDSTN
ncbi:MAG: hypothetical protein ACRDB0_06115 [Paraclostridium sp.]